MVQDCVTNQAQDIKGVEKGVNKVFVAIASFIISSI